MNKSIKQTIDNLNRTAATLDDMEFLDVATETQTQLDLLHTGLKGIHHGVQQNDINANEVDTLRLVWSKFHSNVFRLIHLVRYYELLLQDKPVPDDLQAKIDLWSDIGADRIMGHKVVTDWKYKDM